MRISRQAAGAVLLAAGAGFLAACRASGPGADVREAVEPAPVLHEHAGAAPDASDDVAEAGGDHGVHDGELHPPHEAAAEADAERTALPPDDGPGWQSAVSRGGTYTLRWRSLTEPIPDNDHFELAVRLYSNAADGELSPVTGAKVAVSGWMPDHGHGMLLRPQSQDLGGGSYHIEGMLLHMSGFWQLFFDVLDEGLSERVEFELTVR